MDKSSQKPNPIFLERIRETAKRGALGQAVILSGSNAADAALLMSAAMECESGSGTPCLCCNSCRKVLAGIHPDVRIVVDDEHKMISIGVLREVCSDAYIIPNEGRRKVYIFPDCALLEPKAQNVLLKVVEDGPTYAAFLFCTENSALLLPTIRSRCTEWRLGLEASPIGEKAETLCNLIAGRDKLGLAAFFTGLETGKIKRDELQSLLDQSRELLSRALLTSYGCRNTDPLSSSLNRALSRKQLIAAADLMQNYAQQLRFNLGVGHVTGALGAALTELI